MRERPADLVSRVWRSLPWRALVLVAIAGVATYAFIAIAEQVLEGDADGIDTAIALAIHRISSPSLDHVMVAVTYLGAGITLAVMVALAAIYCFVHERWRLAFVLVANAVGAYGVNQVLKYSFARARPALFDTVIAETSYSFPSAHAMSSMAVYGTIAAVVIALWPRRRWLVTFAAGFLIAAIGFSRVYLGVHWPLDVIAGLTAGIPFVAVAVHLARSVRLHTVS